MTISKAYEWRLLTCQRMGSALTNVRPPVMSERLPDDLLIALLLTTNIFKVTQ